MTKQKCFVALKTETFRESQATEEKNTIVTINSHQEGFDRDIFSGMSIEIPVELVSRFASEGEVSLASYLYYGVENLFPSGFPDTVNRCEQINTQCYFDNNDVALHWDLV